MITPNADETASIGRPMRTPNQLPYSLILIFSV